MMNKKKLKIVAYSTLVYLVLALFTSAYFYNYYQKQQIQIVEQVQDESTRQLAYTHHEFNELIVRISNTLDLLSNNRMLYDYFLYPSSRVKKAVESSWERVISAEKFFSKLILIDESGEKLFGVSYDTEAKKIVQSNQSVKVFNSVFIKKLAKLPEGQIYSEGVSLDSQLASLGIYKPVMQVIVPIDVFGTRQGYVFAELSSSSITNVIQFSPTLSIAPSIVNQDGYYLLTDKPEQVFGHLVNGRADETLKALKPDLWHSMSNNQVGSIYLHDEIYSYYRFSLNKKIPNKALYFLINYPKEVLEEAFDEVKFDLLEELTIVFLLLGLIVIPCGILLTLWDKSNLESQLAKSALEGMSAVVITDKHQRIIKVNPAFSSISGFSSAEVVGKSTLEVLSSNDAQSEERQRNWKQVEELGAWQGEIDVLSKNGNELSLLVRIQVVKNKRKEIQYYIISYIDISRRKLLERELRYLSEKDSLSDCWNRRKFEFELENQTLLTNRYHPVHKCCLAILDIDWFKRINDTLGHDGGDDVIRLVSHLLKEGSRDTDFVARIGGEEFAILMPHTDLADAETVINRLRVSVSQLKEYQLTISGGLTDIGLSGSTAYKCADLALYESKANGRNQLSICTSINDLA
ncbi:diguanylate cyclase [Aliivibrio wodanis]|uniref:diguanylate cyclase n=1 Tax=Aliivibrio wodanis TaxID=80852 RepID=UPI00406D0F60